MINTFSAFPNKVDDMIFFQDVNLENQNIMDHYNNLISYGQYTEATIYISNQHDIYGYFADLFNTLENRIYTLQEYLKQKEKINPIVLSNDEPQNPSIDTIWV